MKLEIDENKVNSMNEEELKEHLALVENSLKILDGHAREVRRRVFEMVKEGCYAKFVNAKEGMKVKVTYKPSYHTSKDKDSVKIGYFVNFGKEPRSGYYNFDLYRLFCNLHRVRKDGTEGQLFDCIPYDFIKSIEPCE